MYPQITFSICGTAKAGTTTLYSILNSHPDICMSAIKETDFFQHNYDKGLRWFESQFSHYRGEHAVGEASPGNIVESAAPKRMFDVNPNMICIFVLRDPISRILSQYYYSIHRGVDRDIMSFPKWIRDDSDPWRNRNIELSRYHKHISRFVNVLGKDRVVLVKFERLFCDANSLRLIFKSLGVNPDIDLNLDPKARNSSSIPVNDTLYRLARGTFHTAKRLGGNRLAQFTEPARDLVRRTLLSSSKSAMAHVGRADCNYLVEILREDTRRLRDEYQFDTSGWQTEQIL